MDLAIVHDWTMDFLEVPAGAVTTLIGTDPCDLRSPSGTTSRNVPGCASMSWTGRRILVAVRRDSARRPVLEAMQSVLEEVWTARRAVGAVT